MERSDAQYLIFNALETLGFIEYELYDSEMGNWYIQTPSSILPRAAIMPSGEIYPTEWVQDYDTN